MSRNINPIFDRDEEIFIEIHEEIELRISHEELIDSGEPLTKFDQRFGEQILQVEEEFDIGGGD